MLNQDEKNSIFQQLKDQNTMLEQQNYLLKKEKDYLAYCLDETRKSFSYRLARAITYVPRIFREKTVMKANSGDYINQKCEISYKMKITQDGIVVISHFSKNKRLLEKQEIQLKKMRLGEKIAIPMTVEVDANERIFQIYEMKTVELDKIQTKGLSKGVLCLYSDMSNYTVYLSLFTTKEELYKSFVHVKMKKASVVLQNKSLSIYLIASLFSTKKADLKYEKAELVIDDNHRVPIALNMNVEPTSFSKVRVRIPLESIISKETRINNSLYINVTIAGVAIKFSVGKKGKKKIPTKFYYVPLSSKYYGGFAIFVRKNVYQNYTLVVRKMEPCEKEFKFRFLESSLISRLLYYSGKYARLLHRKNVNLYFEKYSEKAEEGTYQLFEMTMQSKLSNNYFILEENTSAWEMLCHNKNIIAKYSLKYYWLLYSSDYLISTETSAHLNVQRSANYYVRTALLERPLVFLQHGVTYLKQHGENSVFGKGKEGEPLYIMVGSTKEQNIVSKMLKLKPQQCILTGLPVFSTIAYTHINESSKDIITIMFTWQPSDEHLINHFEDSSYYKKIKQVYELLKHKVPKENIRIVPHPKVLPLLKETDFDKQIWNGGVAEVLKDTKLLITDYSSVCYNAFYQGAAVIFYQTDLIKYEKEVGKLIPQEDEYIGQRVFEAEQLEKVLQQCIVNGQILLSILRTDEYCKRYHEINSFCDGKNVERIFAFLAEKGIV